jgi:guanyl-specific ribonuclease Sa
MSTTSVHPPRRHTAARRLASVLASIAMVLGLAATAIVAPSVVAPQAGDQASAAVYNCGCPASAYTMYDRWDALNWPSGASWRQIGTNRWLYGGAVHYNRERQLPTGASYREYDAQVYSRRGQSRGAKRIVINVSTYAGWYTPNHYTDFYRM